MNERTGNNDKKHDTPVSKSFPSIPRSIQNSSRSQENTDNIQELCFSTFLETIVKNVKESFQIAFCKIEFYFIIIKTKS